MPADALAPNGARVSTGMVVISFRSRLRTVPALEMLLYSRFNLNKHRPVVDKSLTTQPEPKQLPAGPSCSGTRSFCIATGYGPNWNITKSKSRKI